MFDIFKGDVVKVLGWLTYMLETTAAMSPNVTPERDGGNEADGEDLDDPSIDLDDNNYMTPSEGED